ncbi:MAG TPA: protease pro-enzyme activation domain-containing protein, partial [Candidatus Binatia bacterium]|nr:protease pro-enzyme activation domain-containing protein [Candidatus Binatia bacterium]
MRTVVVIFLASALVAVVPDVRGADRTGVRFRSVSPRLGQAVDLGLEAFTTEHNIVIGLGLRNHAALEQFLTDVQDPASAVYHQFLTPDEFNALYAPTPDAEDRIVDYLQAHGLRVTDRFPNRLIVGAAGSVAAIERAFGVEMHTVALNGREHYATVKEPTLPADLAGAVVGVFGLDDLTAMHSRARKSQTVTQPRVALGGKCCHFSPPDLATFYHDAAPYTGAGQTLVIAGAYAWKAS